MRYTVEIDFKLGGFILRKYTNKGILKNTYNLYINKNNEELDCECYNYQKIGVCKHQYWLRRLYR